MQVLTILTMLADSQVQAMLSDQVSRIVSGTSLLIVGLLTIAVAALRRQSGGVVAVFWLGIWSSMYGAQRLNDAPALVATLPQWLQLCIPYLHASITYLMVVAGALTFRELTTGRMRQFLGSVVLTGLLIAVLGIGRFVMTGEENWLVQYNNLLAAGALLVLLVFLMVPSLSRKYGVLQYRGVLLVGSLVFCVEALLTNVARPLGLTIHHASDDLGFAVLLFSLAYVAMQRVHAGERRLSAIESELAIARQLQFSILPTTTPRVRNLRVSAAYQPMTAVAGDFYEFLPGDECRAGFLVADVSGHGVPAALFASMVKVAAQSVVEHAADPGELLCRMRDILSGHLQSQFVSAAYLWIDTEAGKARYSAAGHPPLFCWRAGHGSLERIESNGTLLGVPIDDDFPMVEIDFSPGDRFLLYTDGITEPENQAGEAFGDRQIERILRDGQSLPAAELSRRILEQLRSWQPTSSSQQDDLTLIVIDVL